MDNGSLQMEKIHHGRNIKRIRKEKGIKQETMADKVNLSQQTVSRYESMKTIDEEMLERFARALNISVDDIKSMEEDGNTLIIENTNNTYGDNDKIMNGGNDYSSNTFNPLDKIIELYERLLDAEKEKKRTTGKTYFFTAKK